MSFRKGSIRRSLKYSLWDGLFSSMMMGVSESYLIPYGIALGATPAQVALLASVPPLVASVLQGFSAGVTQSVGSRTKLINFMVFLHALAWLPILLVPYLFERQMHTEAAAWPLLGALTLFAAVGAFSIPAWQSLLSDYIPLRSRGRYFGWRNRLQGLVMVAASVGAGLLLQYFGKDRLVGFTILFVFAMVSRFFAWGCLTQMVEPFRKSTHDEYFSFLSFLRRMPRSNYGRFVLFVSSMSFAANLSAPLLSVFILRELHFGYAAYMTVVTTAALSGFLWQGVWGTYGDYFGNWRVIRVAGWGVAVIPLLWLVSRDLRFLVFVQLFGGCVWGGFSLLALNFMMESVSPQKKIRCLSYYNITNSVAVLAGASLGGWLVLRLPPLQGHSYLMLFLISCLARAAVMALFGGRVRETRRFRLKEART